MEKHGQSEVIPFCGLANDYQVMEASGKKKSPVLFNLLEPELFFF
jgi:hypothetical protein